MEQLASLPLILKRNRTLQPFRAEKLLHTMKTLSWDLNTTYVDLNLVMEKIVAGLGTQIDSDDLQTYAARTIDEFGVRHPDYSRLAGRMIAANLHKTVQRSFVGWVQDNTASLAIHEDVLAAVDRHGPDLDNSLVHVRDFEYNYMAIRTLTHSYLARRGDVVCERPQFMHMRVAITVAGPELGRIIETYDALSRRLYTHATPVLYNAGRSKANFASCFLFQPDTSSTEALLHSSIDIDRLWSAEGGVGLSMGNVPARRLLPSANPGVLALMRIYDTHASFLGSSGAKRPLAATVCLPIWHSDIRPFIICQTSRAPAGSRVSELRPAVWIPDEFMRRLRIGAGWTLFDPLDVPDLLELYGEEFTRAYTSYETSGVRGDTVLTLTLFQMICEAQRETGSPFILYQDAINIKSNQRHMGTVKSSNLCTEIVQFSSVDETAVCTLASIALPMFLSALGFDFEALHRVTKLAVVNTDALIDRSRYPTEAARASALRSRAIAVGVQGFADCLRAQGMVYDGGAAGTFNVDVFETVYHAALEASCELAESRGSYPAWPGSPASMGILQLDMWSAEPTGRYDFDALRRRIGRFGLRNATVTAQMPTASTAHLMGNSEGTDPLTSNVTTHRIQSGEFTRFCPWLVRELVRQGLWSETVRTMIVRSHGSVAGISDIPAATKDIFRTAWEIDPSVVVDMAADRAPYIDQSQSTTLSVSWPTNIVLQDVHIRAWERGLKTGVYYVRCRAPTFPLPYGVPGAHTDGHFRPIITLDDRNADDREDDDDSDPPPPLEPATSPPTPASELVAGAAATGTVIPTSSVRTQCENCDA